MKTVTPIRVLIVDDHALVRSGLRNYINAYDWMELIGEAANGSQALSFCQDHDLDIVLMDIVMPIMDGIEATERIIALKKSIKVIILTSFHEQDKVEQALKSGATSYLLKNVTAEELSQAIRAAESGRRTLAPEATEALIVAAQGKHTLGFDLTKREKEVLTFLVKGYTNSEIASMLSISMATTKYHLTNIFTKLGTKNRVEAVTMALEHKLVDKV